ncbi:DUF7133 domain-containing protein [Marinimicrobium sp. C2-29]|uniref:DUF7133 domain-containing protein n=1 Tax=Marinimicrobium sp. C2-29 TaxID=3139825 RepID=UPI0031398C9A
MKQRENTFGRLWIPLSLAPALVLALAACAPEDNSDTNQADPGQSSAEARSGASDRAVAPLSDEDSEIIRLEQDEQASLSQRVKSQVNLVPAEGLTVDLWAPEKLLGDPVAISVDFQGRVWAAVTNRSNNSEFDIRGYSRWTPQVTAFKTPEDRRDFLRTELAPERSEQNEWLEDRNGDGSRDWRDLAVVKEEVVLLEDTDGNGRADQSQLFLKDFNSEITDVLGGIYYHNELEELFVAVAPNAWRVADTDGDSRADTKTPISDGFGVHIGFSGHGMSGVELGPDGRIYYSIGDVGGHITDLEGNEHAYPNQGVIVRSEPDGSNFEVFARGLRNTHEFDFDQYGNLVTVDNDGDHDGEYERVVYLIDGSDSGWRYNWQLGKYTDPKNNDYKVWMDEDYFTPRFEDQSAHILPPIAPYHAGPTGMVYNPGTALSERWQNHFFVVEFVGSAARSGINAFTLEPKGASFELASDQNVFRGVQATGLDFGPEGALYMSDWIEGWGTNGEGRIWTMDVTDGADQALRADTQELLQADFEALDVDALTEHLSHADRRVRQRAQFALVRRDAHSVLLDVAENSDHQLARIHAIWGLGQLSRQKSSQALVLVPLLDAGLLDDEDPEIRAQSARIFGDVAFAEARESLLPLLEDESLRVQLFAAQALGRIGNAEDQPAIIAMLEANNDEDVYLRHAGATALARIDDAAALAELDEHDSRAVRIAAVVALARLQSPALERFLDDDSEFIVTNAARGISDDHFVEEAFPALAQMLGSTGFDNEPLLRRLINANLYVGGDASAERLLQFVLGSEAKGPLRAEALNTLSVWTDSSEFDRVTGRHRGAVSHPAEQVTGRLDANADALLADDSAEVRAAAVKAFAYLDMQSSMESLVTTLERDASAQVRAAALQALYELDYENMSRAAMTATNDADSDVRLAALALLPELELPTKEVVEMHRVLLEKGTVDEQQAAYRSLANVDHASAHELLGESLEALRAGELPAEVQLDVIEAVQATDNERLQEALAAYEADKASGQPLEKYREALRGGDPEAGMRLFRYDSTAQCIRCHMVGKRGARVGPDLTNIGDELDGTQLLEALVDPGARIPAGHGRITVTLEGGETVSGFFEKETQDSLTIVADDQPVEVAKAEVVKREYSGSGMPPMGAMLNRKQLRDIVAYLATLPTEEESEGH